jgi:acyl-CoA dehydrogenase
MRGDRLAQSDEGPAREFPGEYYNAFASGGWIGIIVPEKYGGIGLGTLHAGTAS